MSFKKQILTIILLVATIVGTCAAKSPAGDDARSRRASYIFYQATMEREAGHYDRFFDLIEYAHRLDTTNTAIGFYYGLGIMMLDNNSAVGADKAMSLMQRHVDACPEDYYEASMYYQASSEMGRWDEAQRVAETQARLHPDRVEALQRLAMCYARAEKYDSVIAIYDRLEQRLGVNEGITQIKVATHEMMGDSAAVLDDWRRLVATAPLDVQYTTSLGNAFLEQAMTDSARVYLERAVNLDDTDGFANFSLATLYAVTGDSVAYEQAIYKTLTECDLDLEMKARILQHYTNQRLVEADSTGRSDALFNRVLEMHPHEVSLRSLYADYLYVVDSLDNALEQLDICLDLEPAETDLWRKAITWCYLKAPRQRTLDYMDRAFSAADDNYDLNSFLASTYYVLHEPQRALTTYDRMWAMIDSTDNTHRSEILAGKADVLVQIGDTIAGIDAYEKALIADPGNTGVMNNYAYCLACANRNLDYALQLISRAVNANPENDNFLDTYAWIYYKRGDYGMALIYIETAMKSNDSPATEVIEHYGDILEANGKHEQAVAQWQRALDQYDPRFDSDLMPARLAEKLAGETPAKSDDNE